jgi:glycosyltransferase involved in cell wall biosynthesis
VSGRPLRILHLVAGSDAGGVSRYLLDLCTAMRDRGHEVTIAGQRGAWHGRFEAAGLPWIEAPIKGGLLDQRRAAATLRAHLDAHPVDVFHAHYRRTTLLGRRLQKHLRAPLLYTLHLSHMPMSWGRRWFSDFGDHVHVASVQAARWLTEQKLADAGRITYVPHGIDPAKFPLATESDRAAARRRFELPESATVAAYVGRLDWPKNEEWLLDVLERSPAAHLLVAGDGPHDAAFRAAIAGRGLGSRVRLLGDVADPLAVYQAADAVLLPSEREGFSYVNAEAMSVGTPMLRTATSGAEDLIQQCVTGWYVAVHRSVFVTAAVVFLSDPQQLRRMGRAGAERVRQRFTLERQVRETIELYRKLTRTGATSS